MSGVQGQCVVERGSAPAHSCGVLRGSFALVRALSGGVVLVGGCSLDGAGTGGTHTIDMSPAGESTPDGSGPGDPPRDDAGPGLPAFDGGSAVSSTDSGVHLGDGTHRDAAARPDAGKPAVMTDARVADAHVPGDASAGNDASVPTSCTLGGTYALRFDYQVAWDDTLWTDAYGASYPVFAKGEGTYSLLARVVVSGAATGSTAVVRPCGVELPDFGASAAGYTTERYGLHALDLAWEAETMPSWTVPWTGTCANAGCTLAVGDVFALLGAKVQSTDEDGDHTVVAVDHDNDGRDAVTFLSRTPSELTSDGRNYAYLPLGSSARARRLDMIVASSGSLAGTFENCNVASGTISDGEAEQHAVGCSGVVTGGLSEVQCDSATQRFIETVLPSWSVSAASFRLVRLSSGSTGDSCAAVRAAL